MKAIESEFHLPDNLTMADISPDILAPVFHLLLTHPSKYSVLYSNLSERLLDLTIQQAVSQCSFYRELYGGIAISGTFPRSDLQTLPIIDRDMVGNAGDAIKSDYATYAFTSYTSGTTTGNPMMIDRSIQEQNYLSAFFTEFNKLQPPDPEGPPFVLTLSILAHGQQLRVPQEAYIYPVKMGDIHGLIRAVRLLERTFTVNGKKRKISSITGTPISIAQLTRYLVTEKLQHLMKQVKQLNTTGQYVTPYQQQILEKTWQCPVNNCFSLTELFLGALSCDKCGYFHFQPYGIAENLQLGSDHPLDQGRGRLILTGFYPFTQMMPLIRYATGDLVESRVTGCINGNVGFKFLGRITDSLDLSDFVNKGCFLAAGEVLEILDSIPDIYRPRLPDPMPESISPVEGMPAFRLHQDENGIARLDAELRYHPQAFPKRVRQLKNSINKELKKIIPGLHPLIQQGKFEVSLGPPGAFFSQYKSFL